MKLWVARNEVDTLELHRRKPSISIITGRPIWNRGLIGFIFNDSFPEVTFENSPREVEIKLIENGKEKKPCRTSS